MNPNNIRIKTIDEREFEVSHFVVQLSQFLSFLYEDVIENDTSSEIHEIKIDNVTGPIMELVLKYCTYHANASAADAADAAETSTDASAKWDDEFVKGIEIPVLCEVIKAANFLNIETLLDLCCKSIAMNIKNMTVPEIRKSFKIKNDFTPEEEADIARENEWCS
jgi:S-phase kinase-associated protein 1